MKYFRKIGASLLSSIILLSQMNVSALTDYADAGINIDGYFDDWETIPLTQVGYNTEPERMNNVGICRDDEFVYLYIHMAEKQNKRFNGANYKFIVDGKQVSFIITTDNPSQAQRISDVTVRYENGYTPVEASSGRLYKPSGGESDQCEAAIPLSSFAKNGTAGNTGIDIDNISNITFSSPNLGPQSVSAKGTSTFPFVNAGLCAIFAVGGIILFNKKRKKTK